MEFLRNLSVGLMLPSLLILIWDLVEHWFVKNMIALYTFKEWLTKISPSLYSQVHNLMVKMGPFGTKVEAYPGFAVFFVPGLVLYLIYRVWFILAGGKQGGYKSRY